MKSTILIICLFYIHLGFSQINHLSDEQKLTIDKLFAAFDAEDSPGYAIGVYKKDLPLYAYPI